MNSPLVSVLMSTYNRASFLPHTLASVFAQTVPAYEVILVDDGSTDDTPAVVESLLSKHPGWAARLRFVTQANQGKSGALNTALRLVRGEWIAFNDSDDVWLPQKLEHQFESLKRFPQCLASFTETTLNEFNDRHPEFRRTEQGVYGVVDQPSHLYPVAWPGTYMQTVVVRTDMMRVCGDIDCHYRLSNDVDFLFRLGRLTPFCYVNMPLVAINREERRKGLMAEYPARSWTAMLEADSMLHKWLSLLDDDSELVVRRIVTRAIASSRSALANRYVLAGDLRTARQILREGWNAAPEFRLFAKLILVYTAPAVLRTWARRRAPIEFLGSHQPVGPAGSLDQS